MQLNSKISEIGQKKVFQNYFQKYQNGQIYLSFSKIPDQMLKKKRKIRK